MPTNILMPALSPTMEKGTLARWLKKEGDTIKSGDVLAEIETDKATMEVEAVDEGVLAKITVPDGTADVPVNQVIGVIAAEGEDPKSLGEAPPAPPPPAGNGVVSDAPTQGEGGAKAVAKPDAAPRPNEAEAEKPSNTKPEGDVAVSSDTQPAYARVDAPPEGAAAPASTTPPGASKPAGADGTGKGDRVFASPLARRIAGEAGIDLARVSGSGPHGRIVQADVKAAMESGAAASPAPAQAVTAAPAEVPPEPKTAAQERPQAATPPSALATGFTADQVKAMYPAGSYEEVALDGMRKTVARRLTESKQTVPHFYLTVDCELDALLALRETINAGAPKAKDGAPAFKLSVNDFVIKALAVALQRVPDANAVWAEDRILKFKASDVGVAVAVDGGLFTPVVRGAEAKTLSAISAEMKDLASRARKRRLKPEEYTGGSTAVSNLGMYGVKQFGAVINPPHGTILAVGAGEKRVVVRSGAPAVATVMTVTLSVDHRSVDGALGAELLAAFKALIEAPMTMLV